MPSAYLSDADRVAYGLPASITTATIRQASTQVDQILNRPEGLVWIPDATGAPAYMAGLTPTMTFRLADAVAPGAQVAARVTPALVTPDIIGDVLILARGLEGACEAVRVISISGRDTLTFASVVYAHAADTTLDQGLLLVEERALPSNRSVTRVSRVPCSNLLSAQGRYSYGRRSDQVAGLFRDLSLLAAVASFGPPIWTEIDPMTVSVSPGTGEAWVPAGLLASYYSDVRLRYVAGWSAANLPAAIKQATANLAQALASVADLPGGQTKLYRAGDTMIQRFSPSAIDPETQALLAPFKARAFY